MFIFEKTVEENYKQIYFQLRV